MLIAALKGQFRSQVVEALDKLGPTAKEAVPALLEALQSGDSDASYAGQVGTALGHIAGPEIVVELERTLAAAKKTRPALAQALAQLSRAGIARRCSN